MESKIEHKIISQSSSRNRKTIPDIISKNILSIMLLISGVLLSVKGALLKDDDAGSSLLLTLGGIFTFLSLISPVNRLFKRITLRNFSIESKISGRREGEIDYELKNESEMKSISNVSLCVGLTEIYPNESKNNGIRLPDYVSPSQQLLEDVDRPEDIKEEKNSIIWRN